MRAYKAVALLVIAAKYVIVWVHPDLFYASPNNGYLGCVQSFATVEIGATINILVHTFFFSEYVQEYLGYTFLEM